MADPVCPDVLACHLISCFSVSRVNFGRIFLLALTLMGTASLRAADVQPYLKVNGQEVAPAGLTVTRAPTAITARFRAAHDGIYSFGFEISARELTPLAPGMKPYSCASLVEPAVLRYPYDWTWRGQGNVLSARPRLVMPGVQADGQLYLADTHELFSLRVEPCHDGRFRALLLAHRFFNDGGDRATPELTLREGDSREFTVRIYRGIAEANQERFGKHDRAMQGYMTQLPFQHWSDRSLTPEEYTLVVGKLQPVFQYVTIQDVQSRSWIPPLFHQRGIKVFFYVYMGALRRFSSQVSAAVEQEIAMHDVNGQLYTAPKAPNGNWLLGDIRRPAVRARFVENARAAIHAGFDGIDMDGYPFWADAAGNIGGNVSSATESWAYARWQLLHEMKDAIRRENPNAFLGALSNQYYDSLGETDWAIKERMYFEWYAGENQTRSTRIRKDLDREFEEQEAIFVPGPLAYGVKGLSPLSVQSSVHFILHPTGLFYTDAGSFSAEGLEEWLDTVTAAFQQKDLYIYDVTPESCWIQFDAASAIESNDGCNVKFSRPVCVTAPRTEPAAAVEKLALGPRVRYEISRECPANTSR